MRDIEQELRDAPRRARPGRDLWPAVEARLDPPRWRSGAWRALRGAALFAAGVALGALWEASPGPAGPPPPAPPADASLVRAIEVQRTGSQYLAALARLSDLPDTGSARRQGYEAALVVVDAAVREVAATGEFPVVTDPMVRQAGRARRAAAERVVSGRAGESR